MDLSQYHQAISSYFPMPETARDWDEYTLTNSQVEFFHENGYLSGVKILNEEQVDILREEINELMDPNHLGHHLFYEYHNNESTDPDKILFHSLGHWRITKGFHDVLWHPAFLKAASQLLGDRSVRFWHDQLFCKPPQHGGVVAWHQDYSYWTRTTAMQHLTCWIALDDATTENGCLSYVPQSHKWGLLRKPELAGDMDGLLDHLTPEQKQAFHSVPVELKKGYATFHHPLLVHGSHANASEHSRRAFVLNVFADGTRSATDEPLLQGVPVVPSGEKITGQFFPLLYAVD